VTGMKVMMVDPWGTYNMYLYTSGLCSSIAKYADLNLWTNYHFPQEKKSNYPVTRVFFKRSEKMKPGYLRNLVRIVEYYIAYFALFRELRENSYDLVHFQWLLHYKTDIIFLGIIKKLGPKVIYTAHNILPHRSSKKHYDDLCAIYSKVDRILVHGDSIKEEFTKLFADFITKINIQRHGAFVGQDLSYDLELVNSEIIKILDKPKKVLIFFGNIFYNKGVDRLAKIWLNLYQEEQNFLLVIAGRKDKGYKELEDIEPELIACSNILYINHFIENNLLNFLLNRSHLVLLPYRSASMSGVLFTAAEFKKPVLSTKTGAIEEYLINDENSFLVENNDQAYAEKLKYILVNIGEEKLSQMGANLHDHIRKNYAWEKIGHELVENTYQKIIS
jgi:glycosyltransferase involved in cell wall biosynthesis